MIKCLRIEIRKCPWIELNRYEIRTGDLEGEITCTGITKEELLEELVMQINRLDGEEI